MLGTATAEIPSIAENDPYCGIVAPKDVGGLRTNILRLLKARVCAKELEARRARLCEKYSWPTALRELFSFTSTFWARQSTKQRIVAF